MTVWGFEPLQPSPTPEADAVFFNSIRDSLLGNYKDAVKKREMAAAEAARALTKFLATLRPIDDTALMDYIFAIHYVTQLHGKIEEAERQMKHFRRTLEFFDDLTRTHA